MPTSTSRSAGLRKFVPQPKRYAERYGNLTITARDQAILETVYRYRYLEARHIRALVGGSDQQITRRLQGLFHNKYVSRYIPQGRMRVELDPGAPIIAYGIELKGVRVLRADYELEAAAKPVRWDKAHTRRTSWFLKHRLMQSQFRCILELGTRKTPDVTLMHWDEGDSARCRTVLPGPKRRQIGLAPDAIFTLDVAGRRRHFFLEIDRGTEEQSRLARKYEGYWWYLQSPEFRRAFHEHRRANVLFVTTGERRLQNMLTTLREMPKPNRADHGGKGLFWFCCHHSLSLDRPESALLSRWRTTASSQGPRLTT